MPVIARFRVSPENIGLLAVALPQVRLLRRPFPAFLGAKRVIVVCDDDPFTRYPETEVIQLTSRAPFELDSRSGFLAFMKKNRGVTVTKYQEDRMLFELDDADFWRIAKLALYLKSVPELPLERVPGEATVLDVFETLFEDFGETYRRYRNSRTPAPVLFSSLLTMMNKTIDVDQRGGIKPYYRRILKKNQKYLRRYRIAFLRHRDFLSLRMDSDRRAIRDMDMVDFLGDCSDPETDEDTQYDFELSLCDSLPR